MRFLSLPQLEHATRELNHVGSLVGGWIRQQEGKHGSGGGAAPAVT